MDFALIEGDIFLRDPITGNPVAVVLDGSIYRLQTEAQLQTQAKGSTPAGHPTSKALDADTQALHVLLKHATGNDYGDVRIVDSDGHVVGLVLDGSLYRFQTDSKVAKNDSGDLVHLEALDVSTGVGRAKSTLYSVDGDPVSLFSAPSSPAGIRNDFVKNGSSADLTVDGSTTPVEFTYSADATYDISLQEITFVLVANSVTFGSSYFGSKSGPLTNGLKVEITANSITGTVLTLVENEDFDFFKSPGGFDWIVSSKDLMSSSYVIGGGLKLIGGSSDNVKVTVQDDLSSAAVYFKCFVKGNLLS